MHRSLPGGRRARVIAYRTRPSAVVHRFKQTPLDSSQLAIWTRLDTLVRSDGNLGLVGLAKSWIESHSDTTLPAAIDAQCRVVCSIFWTAGSGTGLCRNCLIVARDPGNIDRILESRSGRGLVTAALSDLGCICGGAQFFNLAVEHMIRLDPIAGVSH